MKEQSKKELEIMAAAKRTVIDYLQDELKVNSDALRAYEPTAMEGLTDEVKKLREVQAMILRDRIAEINRHIAVIKRMYPES